MGTPGQICILWVDDEILLLQPYVLFLEQKGYRVLTASNAQDALAVFREQQIDLIFSGRTHARNERAGGPVGNAPGASEHTRSDDH